MSDAIVPERKLREMLLKEWTDCAGGLEKSILRLEVHYRDTDLNGEVLDTIRRVKRGAAYVGATGILNVVHAMESAVRTMLDRGIEADAELIDLLLAAADVLDDAIRTFADAIAGYGPGGEDGMFALGPEAEAKWEGIVRGLRDYFGRVSADGTDGAGRAADGSRAGYGAADAADAAGGVDAADGTGVAAGGAAVAAGGMKGAAVGMKGEAGGSASADEDAAAEDADIAKERLIGEIYGHLDGMADCLAALERDARDRGAAAALAAAARAIEAGIGKLRSVLPAEAAEEMLEVARLAARWLESVGAGGQSFAPEWLVLGREASDYMKAALESAAMGDGGAVPSAKLQERLRKAHAEPASAGAQPATAAGPVPDPPQGNRPPSQPQSIRVSQDKLDKMMDMISELLIAKNAFMHLSAKLNAEYDLPELSKEMKEVGFSVNRITDELQNAVMSIRMVEIKTVFQKMPRIVRDVAQLTGKKMELVMAGETTEIDKTIVESISDPLVHLIRNAADHGIEDAEERLRKGKRETGRIELRAYNKDKHVCIEIEDDGKGIDPEALKRKALEKGLIAPDQAEKMSRSQLVNLIFLPGFSTARRITGVSGRGVGMDIVKSNIEKIGGTIFIDSEVDRGTKVVIRLPLTLAISRGLIVEAARESYIIPIEYISETVKIASRDIHRFDGNYFAVCKGAVVSVEWLAKLFLLGERDLEEKDEFHAVMISAGAEKFGIIVDKLLREQEFVIKPLHGQLAGIPGISGSTLLGDGQVVLIVNPLELMRLAKNG